MMRTPQSPGELHATDLEALYALINGAYRARRGYHPRVMRGLIRAGYAVATSNTTAEITNEGRAAYLEATTPNPA